MDNLDLGIVSRGQVASLVQRYLKLEHKSRGKRDLQIRKDICLSKIFATVAQAGIMQARRWYWGVSSRWSINSIRNVCSII